MQAIGQRVRIQKLGSAEGTRFPETPWKVAIEEEVSNAPADFKFTDSFISSFVDSADEHLMAHLPYARTCARIWGHIATLLFSSQSIQGQLTSHLKDRVISCQEERHLPSILEQGNLGELLQK